MTTAKCKLCNEMIEPETQEFVKIKRGLFITKLDKKGRKYHIERTTGLRVFFHVKCFAPQQRTSNIDEYRRKKKTERTS